MNNGIEYGHKILFIISDKRMVRLATAIALFNFDRKKVLDDF